jgi:hypothetical protein
MPWAICLPMAPVFFTHLPVASLHNAVSIHTPGDQCRMLVGSFRG